MIDTYNFLRSKSSMQLSAPMALKLGYIPWVRIIQRVGYSYSNLKVKTKPKPLLARFGGLASFPFLVISRPSRLFHLRIGVAVPKTTESEFSRMRLLKLHMHLLHGLTWEVLQNHTFSIAVYVKASKSRIDRYCL